MDGALKQTLNWKFQLFPPDPSPTLPPSVADETRPGRSVPCLDSVDAEDILPKWYQNSKQDWLFENLTIDRMPSKHPIKSKDYGGQLRRPGENLEGSTPDEVPQETSSVSNQSENGEN